MKNEYPFIEYLGDGVYVRLESGMVKLTTSNGEEDTNTIFLEAGVLNAFVGWIDRMQLEHEE